MLFNRESFSSKYPKIAEGTTVYCRDGEKLGVISSLSDESLTVKRGVFFPKDFTLRYDDIDQVKGDAAYLKITADELKQWRSPEYSGWDKVAAVNVGKIQAEAAEPFREEYNGISSETVKVPLFEEELEAKKTVHQTGSVIIKKIVHTELRHMTVPLAHEEIRIERIKGDRTVPVSEENAREAFTDRTVTVSAMDEDVEVSKRPVVKEEVRVTKERRMEDRDVSDNIRSEDVEIEKTAEEEKAELERKRKVA